MTVPCLKGEKQQLPSSTGGLTPFGREGRKERGERTKIPPELCRNTTKQPPYLQFYGCGYAGRDQCPESVNQSDIETSKPTTNQPPFPCESRSKLGIFLLQIPLRQAIRKKKKNATENLSAARNINTIQHQNRNEVYIPYKKKVIRRYATIT